MKSLAAALIVLSLLLGTMTANGFYIRKVCGECSLLIAKAETPAQASALAGYWETKRKTVSLTVGFAKINRMDDLTAEFPLRMESGDPSLCEVTRAQLQSAIEEIRRLECFSWNNVF